jgi:pilus assembly protein CpaB
MSSPHRSSVKVSAAKFGALGFIAVALGCAALAAFAVGNMMQSKYTGERVVPVVVAGGEIRAGEPLGADMLSLRDWPENAVPPGAFHSVEALLETYEGSTPTVGILPGEPVVASRMSGEKTGTGIASLIRPNMRAFALKVDDSVGYTGLVYPGAFVDLIATIRDPLGRGPSSRIAVQNARVLSVGMDADVATRKLREKEADRLTGSQSQGGTYVTLEVTPEEAEIMSIARKEGAIDLILRNATDDELIDTDGATPVAFSAFAIDADDEPEIAELEPETVTPTKKKRRRHKNRRMQIVASDKPDTAKPAKRKTAGGGRIKTYNAN